MPTESNFNVGLAPLIVVAPVVGSQKIIMGDAEAVYMNVTSSTRQEIVAVAYVNES